MSNITFCFISFRLGLVSKIDLLFVSFLVCVCVCIKGPRDEFQAMCVCVFVCLFCVYVCEIDR